jgi:carbonic anhydrase
MKFNTFFIILISAVIISITYCASNNISEVPPEDYASEALPELASWQSVSIAWSYYGDRGPEFWYYLDPSFYLANEGKSQSPIDIDTLKLNAALNIRKPDLHYSDTEYILYDDGHTIEAIPEKGDNHITLDGRDYALRYFDFHVPGEHTIDGREFEMEIHLFHEDAAGNLAVVSILLEEGDENKILREAFSYLSWVPVGGAIALDETINLSGLFDEDVPLYRYDGSLTMPPCTEGVKWSIYSRPVSAARYQLEAFRGMYMKNSRPVQRLNNRSVYVAH